MGNATGREPLDSNLEQFGALYVVFALGMLREKILDYAMRYDDGSLCGSYIAKLRLVAKPWLVSVSRILAQYRQPLYLLTLDKQNSLNDTPFVRAHGKVLDQFVSAMAQRIESPFPTFRLEITEEFFRLENYDSLYACLLRCGEGLVDLDWQVPKNGGSLPCIFSNVDFPVLDTLRVEFSKTVLTIPKKEKVIVENSANITMLLQLLLNKNESLTEMEFSNTKKMGLVPVGFQYVGLPTSITKLTLDCRLQGHELEILTRSVLPNLHTLSWRIANTIYPDGLINKVFENLQKSLVNLDISGLTHFGYPRAVNYVCFPVMEKLETFSTYCINWELEENIDAIHQHFPKLHTLDISYQTKAMFHKWTSGSPAIGIETLDLQLVDDNFSEDDIGFQLPVAMEDMQRVHMTFSNITALTLTLTGTQTCGLKYLFMEMKQLTYLGFIVAESKTVENSDCWDSILIGVPIEMITALRVNPEFCKYADFKNQEVPSILMLTALETLSLGTCDDDAPSPNLSQDLSLISDLTFTFALMKMPKLKQLDFYGRFKASDASVEGWKKEGRCISYDA